jgi:glutathione S-transferase
MITVHHLNNSRSQRVLWLLEELALPYEIAFYQRDPNTMLAPASLKAVHPLGKSPVLTDGEVTIAESAVIIEYLVEKYGAGKLSFARGTKEYLQYLYFMHYAEGSVMPPLVMKLVFSRLPRSMPWALRGVAGSISKAVEDRFIDPQLLTHASFLETHLATSAWFAGADFSAADIQMSFPIEALAVRAPRGLPTPHLKAFLEKIHARPAYQAALAKGGPLQILG